MLFSEFSQSTYEEGRALVRACKHWGVGLGSPFFIQGGLKKKSTYPSPSARHEFHTLRAATRSCELSECLQCLWPGHTNPTAEQQWQLLWLSLHCGSPNTAWQPLFPRSAHLNRSCHPPCTPSEAAGSLAEVGTWGAGALQPRQAGPLRVVGSSSVQAGGLCLPVLASAWAPADLCWGKAATVLLLLMH